MMDGTQVHALRSLSGEHAPHYLAALGCLRLSGDARLRFVGDSCTPELLSTDSWEALSGRIGDGLTHLLEVVLPRDVGALRSTTPPRSEIEDLMLRSWSDEGAALCAALFDQSGIKNADGESQVVAPDLTLISGRSHYGRSVSGVDEATVRHDVARLFRGEPLTSSTRDPMLRFTVRAPAPRIVSGQEQVEVLPALEILALVGQAQLPARQREETADPPGRLRERRKALSWVCNAIDMPLQALVDLQESPPAHLPWPRFTALIESAGGGAKYSILRTATREA